MAATIMIGAGHGVTPVTAADFDSVMTDVTAAAGSNARTAPTTRGWENPLIAPDESMIGSVLQGLPAQPGVWSSDGTTSEPAIAPRAFGSFGIPYTSTRVQLGPHRNVHRSKQLVATYPYRTVGKLLFTLPDGRRANCSASVIQRGLIVTAAHCVAGFGAGSGNFYSDFLFIPAFQRVGTGRPRPYGDWTSEMVAVPAVWTEGTDRGCGAARSNDIAVLALAPRRGRAIGDLVGSLGYGWNDYSFVSSSRTGNLTTGAVTTLGYPAILDRGNAMQRVDGPTYPIDLCSGEIVNYWQGSNLGGGASGGPLVVNFSSRSPELVGGATVGSDPVIAVIGVTSWGAADPNTPKDNYSSRFGQNDIFPGADYGGRGAGNIGAIVDFVCTTLGSDYCW